MIERNSAEKRSDQSDSANPLSDEAVAELLETCRDYLLLVANDELLAALRSKVAASDLVQDTLIEAQRDFRSFRGQTDAELLAWLRRILLNNLRDLSRHFCKTGKRQISLEVPIAEVTGTAAEFAVVVPSNARSPSSCLRASERREIIEEGLQRLPDHYHRVIVMRNLELRSFPEIGRELGRSADAVRKLWSRAIESLQAELEGLDELERS